MSATEMEISAIVVRQKLVADELARLKANATKYRDSSQKKTTRYREERLEKANSLWLEFQENHCKIIGVIKQYTPYIQGDTIGRVTRLYREVKEILEAIVPDDTEEGLETEPEDSDQAGAANAKDSKPTPAARVPATAESSPEEVRLIRRQKSVHSNDSSK